MSGRLLDSGGRPIPNALVEIWQANAAGRYRHVNDNWPAPIDPNFTGAGRCLTDSEGGYRFLTIKPGAYPWKNHANAWRPAHIHFSLFGRAFTQRLVTQMYFPGDPLFSADPIFNSVPDPAARERMISSFDWDTTEDHWQLGFNVGHRATRPRGERVRGAARMSRLAITPSQTVGPFFTIGLTWEDGSEVVRTAHRGRSGFVGSSTTVPATRSRMP